MANSVNMRVVSTATRPFYAFGAYTLVKTTWTAVDLDLVDVDFLDNLLSAQLADQVEAQSHNDAQFEAKINISKFGLTDTPADTAATVAFTAGGTLAATTVQTAVAEAALEAVQMTGDQTVAGIKTFSSAPVVPDDSFAIGKTTGLQAALDLKAADADVVHLAGTEAVTGTKTFTAAVITRLNNTSAATATAGGGEAVPATVLGYIEINLNGTAVKIPYFTA